MVEEVSKEEMKHSSEDNSDVWHLRKEYVVASKALRHRKNDDCEKTTSTQVEEQPSMKTTTEKSPRPLRRPGLVHRKTDPCPMREFVKNNWTDEAKLSSGEKNIIEKRHETISEGNANETIDLKKDMFNEEQLFISSYDLAKRRLSLPLTTLSKVEQTWSSSNVMFDDSDDTDSVSLETPAVKNANRPSCIKQLHHSPMERRRRQSAWIRRPYHSMNEAETSKPLGKRRMSELPALSALATRRRSVPHTLSLPHGLRRKTSRAGNSSDYQSHSSSCLKAKNEMLATLSLSAWSEGVSLRHHEICRRKSCHTGFGIMALKKKEEKRLMVAHEILQTEKNYIKALETLNEVFTEPLKNSCVIPEKDIRTMFPKQLVAMKNGHESFMKELDDRLNNWKWQGILGDIFAKLGNSYHVDFMTLYSEYVNNFPQSIAVINKYTRNSQKFKRFLEKSSNDPRCERLNISAFLLTPIQRLPRYVLLLRQLAKYTDPNHPDSFHIEISLEKMIDIINILNSSIQNSTRVATNVCTRRSTRRRRKRHIFKAKESITSDLSSPRKSSDDSELSEASTPSVPYAQDLSPLTIDTTSPNTDMKSSDYGSLTTSEPPSEPTSPSPSSTSSSRSNFLKVILRNSGESKRSKRRPCSTTEVEIIRRKDCSQTVPKEELQRSVSRDSIGSIIRHKFGTLRRRPRSSEENLESNHSLERLADCRTSLFKYGRPTSPDDDIFREDVNEIKECSKSDSDLLENMEQKAQGLNSGSSMESCTGSREHFPLSREQGQSDSDDSTSHPDSRPTSRLEGDVHDNNNQATPSNREQGCKSEVTEEQLTRKKLGKRNSFTNAVRYFFVSKTRSSTSSPETVIGCSPVTDCQAQLFRPPYSKEKISTV